MPKFYEIKLFTRVGYFSLILFSYFGFSGGRGLPIGLVLIIIPFIVELIISIYYINVSKENRKTHFLCFSILIFIFAVFAGIGFDIYETEKTRRYLINIDNRIEEYMNINNIKYLSENDIKKINLPDNIRINNMGDEYLIRYKDGEYYSTTKTVYFKSRP